MSHFPVRRAGFLILCAALLAGGCASKSRGEEMVQSFSRTRQIVTDARSQVGQTLASLQVMRVTQGPALADAFRRYKEAVGKLQSEGADANWRATAAKKEAEAHIQAWQNEMKQVQDPQIKSTLESRREAVRTNFKLIQMYADDARRRFGPFLKGNKDIVQALSIDLSPAAISALAPSIDRVVADGRALDERLSAMQRALDNIAAGVSPLGG